MVLNNFKNILYNRYLFGIRTQNNREPLEDFINDLMKLAQTCDFNNAQERIRDQIIVGINDHNLRGGLFTLKNPELNELLEEIKNHIEVKNEASVNKSIFEITSGLTNNEPVEDCIIVPAIKKEKDAQNEHENEIEIIDIKQEEDEDEFENRRIDEDESKLDENTHPEPTSKITKGKVKCKICPNRYQTKRGLQNHMRVHKKKIKSPNTKNYVNKCEHCNESFRFKTQLKNHIRSQHLEKKHKCRHCDKIFVYACRLKEHVFRFH